MWRKTDPYVIIDDIKEDKVRYRYIKDDIEKILIEQKEGINIEGINITDEIISIAQKIKRRRNAKVKIDMYGNLHIIN